MHVQAQLPERDKHRPFHRGTLRTDALASASAAAAGIAECVHARTCSRTDLQPHTAYPRPLPRFCKGSTVVTALRAAVLGSYACSCVDAWAREVGILS